MLSNATIRDFLRFLDPFFRSISCWCKDSGGGGQFATDRFIQKSKKKEKELKFSLLNGFFLSLKLEKSIRNNLEGPQRLLDFGKELHRQTWWTWGGGIHGIYKSTSRFQISYKILIKKHYTYFSIWIESSWDCEFNNPIPMPASTLKVCWNRL